jgi:peptidoglycan/xylan/chitin deacetylase (PgdA/CDA1 family)
MYHDVPASDRAAFAAQCALIARLSQPSRLDELSEPADGVWKVAVTFDDGFRSYRDVALPEMEAHGIPSAVFVPTDWAHRSAREYPLDDPTAVMTPDELAALPAAAEIGGHSRSHRRLSTLDDESLRAELSDAREELREMTGRDIRYHAFPHGDHDHRVDTVARDAGFSRCYGVRPTLATDPHDFVVGRVQVDPSDGPLEFKLKVLGAYRWMGTWMNKRDGRRSAPPTGAHA